MSKEAYAIKSRKCDLTVLLDTGEGYKRYDSGSIKLTPPIAHIKGRVDLSNAREKLSIFINSMRADSAFTITQTNTRVEFESNTDTTLFNEPLLLDLEVIK